MKIGIVGLGLIGGSLGLDFVQQGHQVIGIARRPETCQAAMRCQAVHQASSDYGLLTDVDVVFICTPIALIEPTVAAIAPWLADHAIVTDVGSVKASITEAATRHWPLFVGGHPMAGKTEVGIEAAEAGLFAGRAYVLTPIESTAPAAIQTLTTLVQHLKADLYQCSPEIHDRSVAWISHLPVMVSNSLIHACLQETDPEVANLARQLASSGFRDTSRVGGGTPELGLMMAQYNRAALLKCLQVYRDQLDQTLALIQAEHWDQLHQRLMTTRQARPDFLH